MRPKVARSRNCSRHAPRAVAAGRWAAPKRNKATARGACLLLYGQPGVRFS
jgi:hypothetical protein